MKIIGHRGAASIALENTLESIAVALSLDIDAIEFDVRRTKDNQLVVMHDEDTGRIAAEKLSAHKSTLKEIQKLRLHNNEHIPSLDEALQLIGSKKPVIIDIKDNKVADQILEIISRHPDANISFTGLHYQEMLLIKAKRPDIEFYVQNHFSPIDIVQTAKALGASGVSLNMWLLNPLTYFLTRRYKLKLMVYTVNHTFIGKFIKFLYPEVLICTNNPRKF